MDSTEGQEGNRIIVGLVGTDGQGPEFDSIVALLDWRAVEGKGLVIGHLAFTASSSSDEACVKKVVENGAKGALHDEDGQLSIVCQGDDSIGLLLRMLRWYNHDRFADAQDVSIKVEFAGLPGMSEFGSPEMLDVWLAGQGRGAVIETLVYKASTSYVGSKAGRYNRPGPCTLEVADGKVTVSATGPRAADTLTRVLYLHSLSLPGDSTQD